MLMKTFLSFLLFAIALDLTGTAAEMGAKPVLLYTRHFNAEGETRYLPDGNYKEVLTRLGAEFEVRVSRAALNEKMLTGVKVVLISNPSDKAVGTNPPPSHVSPNDVKVLSRFVEQGGGLIVMGNQENHNLEVQDLNRLLKAFGMQFENEYTDFKPIKIAENAPIIGGLRWGYFSGNRIQLESKHPAKPQSLVTNDLSVKTLNGPRNVAGCLLAVAEPGKGHVVVVTDAGWITDDALQGKGVGGVAIKEQDNFEIMRRLSHWAAGRP